MDGRSRQAVAARSRWSRTCVAAQVGRHVVVDGDRRCNGRVGRRLLERSRWCPSGGRSRQGRGRSGHDSGSRAVTVVAVAAGAWGPVAAGARGAVWSRGRCEIARRGAESRARRSSACVRVAEKSL